MQRIQGFAEQGDTRVFTAGHPSSNVVQGSFPFATVTVYLTGTTTLAVLYSDDQPMPTPLANPFTADANGHWFFYAPNGRYDIRLSGRGLCPWTIGDVLVADPSLGPVIAQASGFNFRCQYPGMNLVPGSNLIPLNPMPRGMAVGNSVYISGGVGTAEAARITGVGSDTITVICVAAHSGSYSVCSATCGIQEAIGSFPQQGGMCLVDTNCTLHADVTDLGKHSVMVTRLPQSVITANNFTILKGVPSNFSRQQTWMNAPNFDTLNTLHGGIQFDMGGFPDVHMYNFTTGPFAQALAGSVVCTGTTTIENPHPIPAIAGVAGYSETYVVAQSSVGVLGMGQLNGHNQFAWGANLMCGNGGHDDDLSGSWLYGLEVDANLWAAQPPLGMTGIAVAGNMITKPVGSTAVWVSLNPNTYKWDRAYHTEDGATNIAVDAGTAEEPNVYPSQSQAIFLSSRDSGNRRIVNDIFVDQYGDLQLSTGRYLTGAQETRGAVVINIQASSGGAPGSVLFPDTGGFYIKPTTFANLPVPVPQGTIMTISDGAGNTPGQAAAGGGSYFVAVMWAGTQWTVL